MEVAKKVLQFEPSADGRLGGGGDGLAASASLTMRRMGREEGRAKEIGNFTQQLR